MLLARLIFPVIVSLCLTTVSAWSSGSGTCYADQKTIVRLASRHPIADTMGFYLSVPSSYKLGESYNISILNTGALGFNTFNGFLLYAVDSKNDRVGTFSAQPLAGLPTTTNMASAAEAAIMGDGNYACDSAPAATITHGTGVAKPVGFSVVWTAPTTDYANVTFVGVVTYSSITYWSQVLTPATICSPSTSGCNGNVSSSLPSGPLPPLPPNSYVPSVNATNMTLCAPFGNLVPNTYIQPGWCPSFWVPTGLNDPRGMHVTSKGVVLLVESGAVSVLRDQNNDGAIDINSTEKVQIISYSGLNHGIWLDEKLNFLYVSTPTVVIRYAFDPANPTKVLTGTQHNVIVGIPGGGHSTRTMVVDGMGRLYVMCGSAGNIDRNSIRSRIKRWTAQQVRDAPTSGWPWSSTGEIFADGLRNEVGMNFDLNGELWGVMNADDNLNRPELGGRTAHYSNPAEPLHYFAESKAGKYWGYPTCFANYDLPMFAPKTQLYWNDSSNPPMDNHHGLVTSDAYCQNTSYVEPIAYAMPGHYAPLGLEFYDATKSGPNSFPRSWHNQLFVTSHGSWNAVPQVGRQLFRIDMDERNEPTSHHEFFGSFAGADWNYRPVEVRELPTGELLVTAGNGGSRTGAIFIIRYAGYGSPPSSALSPDVKTDTLINSVAGFIVISVAVIILVVALAFAAFFVYRRLSVKRSDGETNELTYSLVR